MLPPAGVMSCWKRPPPGPTLLGWRKGFCLMLCFVAEVFCKVVTSYSCDDQGLDGRYVAVGRADFNVTSLVGRADLWSGGV